jgi:erythromycin esterase-like protein
MHAAALLRIPESLRSSLRLCEHAQSGEVRDYQEARDRENAEHAIALRDTVSRSHRVILWAHHSHVAHNTARQAPASMGQHLRQRLGRDLYTIGLFAGRGRATEIDDDRLIPAVPRAISTPSERGLEALLGQVRGDDFFIDWASLDPAAPGSAFWFQETTMRMEPRRSAAVVPARDFDAAVFVQEVRPASLTILPPVIATVVIAYGYILDFGAPLAATAAIALVVLIARSRRRRT